MLDSRAAEKKILRLQDQLAAKSKLEQVEDGQEDAADRDARLAELEVDLAVGFDALEADIAELAGKGSRSPAPACGGRGRRGRRMLAASWRACSGAPVTSP